MMSLLSKLNKDQIRILKDGEPCDHPGCRGHISHPCEVCGRIACRTVYVPDTVYHQTKWLMFRFLSYSQTKVTSIWEVLSKSGKIRLGLIKWHSPWRCYAFFPEKDTIFSVTCIKDIVLFINNTMVNVKH
jgi:hypothetical protein